MNNGHFAGKLQRFVENAVEKSKGTEGSLYKIMNSYGFYDVADENNGLTDWQRASVPDYNQHRISELCNAIADMFNDILANPEYGIMYPNMDNVVGKLDLNATKTASEMNVVSGALGALTGGASESARQAMGNLTAVLMGGFAFDPDILPPIALNIPSISLDFSLAFPRASFPADWTFLYDHETVKSATYYEADDGSVAIGAGIKLNMGGPATQRVLKLIFSVPDVDENGTPVGDSYGGLSIEDYNKLCDVAEKPYSEVKDDSSKAVTLNALQMELAYFRMIQLTLWGAIKNPDNWAYLHWGCLTHNACPLAVKTAVCEFIHTNGFAVDPKCSPEAGFISYCVNTGMAYLTGRKRKTELLYIPGLGMKELDDKKKTAIEITGKDSKWYTAVNGLPVSNELANLHFTLAADILSHLTYDTSADATALRKCRVDEANLIYNYVGLPTMKFGDAVIPSELSANAMEKRGFGKLVSSLIKVYENKNATLPLSDKNCKIVNNAEKGANQLSNVTILTIKYLIAKAKLPGIVVTSVYRSPEAQTNAMYNNRQKHNGEIAVSYAARGRQVDQIYTDVSKLANNGQVRAIKDPTYQKMAKDKMQAKCEEFLAAGTPVSNHGYDPNVIQAVDMGPNSTKAYFRLSDDEMRRFNTACWDAYMEGYLKAYFGPEEYGGPKMKDPAFHIEVWQDSGKKHPGGFGDSVPSPSVDCRITDANLKNKATWDMVYVHDQTMEE